jgi:hypothetical protein
LTSHQNTLKSKDWNILYATEQHGFHLKTLYRSFKKYDGPSLLIAMDDCGYIFGAFCSQKLKVAPTFYGDGQCFLMSINPIFKYYPWTKQNNNFIVSRDEFIGFGGGYDAKTKSGGFGLWLDASFTQGTSENSVTYGNQCIASSDRFKCVAVELWSFVTASSLGSDNTGSSSSPLKLRKKVEYV